MRPIRAALVCLVTAVAISVPATAVAAGPGGHAHWEQDIRAFESGDRSHPPPRDAVLFVGSSSIRFWETLAADFPGVAVINRGFGGSDIDDATHFADRIVTPYAPRAIVLYAGDNDLMNGDTPEQVRDDVVAFVARVRRDLPGVPVAFIAIKPSHDRITLLDAARRANDLVREYAAGVPDVAVLDIFSPMLDASGRPRAELFIDDGLHLNARGYALWREVVAPWVAAQSAR